MAFHLGSLPSGAQHTPRSFTAGLDPSIGFHRLHSGAASFHPWKRILAPILLDPSRSRGRGALRDRMLRDCVVPTLPLFFFSSHPSASPPGSPPWPAPPPAASSPSSARAARGAQGPASRPSAPPSRPERGCRRGPAAS